MRRGSKRKVLLVEPSEFGRRLFYGCLERSQIRLDVIAVSGLYDLAIRATELALVLAADCVIGGDAIQLVRHLRRNGYAGHVAIFGYGPVADALAEQLLTDQRVSVRDKSHLLGRLPGELRRQLEHTKGLRANHLPAL